MNTENQSKKLADLLARNYPIRIHTQGDMIYLYIDELYLMANDQDLDIASNKLKEEKLLLFKKYIGAGISDDIPLPLPLSGSVQKLSLTDDLSRFLLKMTFMTYHPARL